MKGWNNADTDLELDTIKTGNPDKPNVMTMEEQVQGVNKITTPEELKTFVTDKKTKTGKGLSKDDIPMLAGQALYNVAIRMADRMLPVTWDELADTNSMWSFIKKDGGMTYDTLIAAVKRAVRQRAKNDDTGFGSLIEDDQSMLSRDQKLNALKDYFEAENQSGYPATPADWLHSLGDREIDILYKNLPLKNTMGTIDEKSKSKSQQRFMGMVHALQKGEISPSDVGSSVEKAAASMSDKDAEDFASTKHKGLPEKVDEYLVPDALISSNVTDVQPRAGEKPFMMNGSKWEFETATFADGKKDIVVYSYQDDVYYDYEKWREAMNMKENNIKEDTQTMIGDSPDTMAFKPEPAGTVSKGGVPMGMQATGGGMSEADVTLESANKLLEELNNELEAYSIHHNKLKKMNEDRKTSSLVMKDRLGGDNEANFKKDLQHSGTKKVIDVEKELQYKDQQTDVGDDPQKLGQDLEEKELEATDAKSGEALKNVGDSANDKGDELPKRNLTTKEQEEVNMYRLGQHSLVYDNEPGKRFEDRMKADMGDDIYKMRQKQLEFRGKAPMYNKDPQPVEDTTSDKVQFNKEQSGWNERVGLKETMITGRFVDSLGKKYIKDFRLNEAQVVNEIKDVEGMFELDFTGFGNKYKSKTQDYKVTINEGVENILSENRYFTDGNKVVSLKKPVQKLNENEQKAQKSPVNEQYNKMKHLLDYKPKDFVDTNNVKKNRGF